jgi:acrylyl-CoA reductase (NADPH)
MVEAITPDQFPAYRIHLQAGRVEARWEQMSVDELSAGEVVIRVSHSSINYKDALAASGAGRILRRSPLVGGIDLAGRVESSSDPRFVRGAEVLVTGCGLSETRDGGYALYARVPAAAVVPMPTGLDAASAMALGTAGFAAGLAYILMERNGQRSALGPVAVTGASGGVGSVAVDMFASKGFEVSAMSGKREAHAYLRELGAAQVLLREQLGITSQPLETAHWGGAIDNVGGELLSWLLRSTRERGNVASIGLAASSELHTTVLPFILRGVSLLGVNSSSTIPELRAQVWSRLATDLKPRHLDRIVTRTIDRTELAAAFDDYLHGRVIGRTVVRME